MLRVIGHEWHVKSDISREICQEWYLNIDKQRVICQEWYVKSDMARVSQLPKSLEIAVNVQ